MLATFQVLGSHMWLTATILGSTNTEHVHHCRRFWWTAPPQRKTLTKVERLAINGKHILGSSPKRKSESFFMIHLSDC